MGALRQSVRSVGPRPRYNHQFAAALGELELLAVVLISRAEMATAKKVSTIARDYHQRAAVSTLGSLSLPRT